MKKANILIELYALNVTIKFDLGHDLDLEFTRSNMTSDVGVLSTHLVFFPKFLQ